MRESQMKKIIAAAVATALVAPAFAADVTISGDLEHRFVINEDDGFSSPTADDVDVFVTVTEEVNGLSVKAVIGEEDMGTAGGREAELHVSGSFGTVSIGTVNNAAASVDEIVDVAAAQGGDANPSHGDDVTSNTIAWTLPAMVDGLTLIASMGVEEGTDNAVSTDELETMSYAAKYVAGPLTGVYAVIDVEDAAYTTNHASLSYSSNGIFVGIASTSDDGAANTDTQTAAVKYTMGDTSFYYEANESDAGGTVTETDVMGVGHKVGGGLSVYAEMGEKNTPAATSNTTFGVKYAF
jgi:hypothetical protein